MNAIGFKVISVLTRWFTRFIGASILFFVFTLLGGIVFGIFPSLTGLFAVTRSFRRELLRRPQKSSVPMKTFAQGDRQQPDASMIALYWCVFRQKFATSNLLGWMFTAGGVILVIDLHSCLISTVPIYHLAVIPSIVLLVLYLIIFTYVFPVISHYHVRPIHYIRISCALAVSQPMMSLGLIILVSCYAFLLRGLLPVLGISVIAIGITFIVYRAIERMDMAIHKQGGYTVDAK